MKGLLLLVSLIMSAGLMYAQEIRVYGTTEHEGKAEAGVMIMVFEGERFYKKFYTDKKGHFRFSIGPDEYTILFYKPGKKPEAYRIVNHMDPNTLQIPIYMEIKPATMSPDSMLQFSPLITKTDPRVADAYIKAVYDYERRQPRKDTTSLNTKSALVRRALEEKERFSTYRKATDSAAKTTITIGPDTYVLATDAKGAVRYYKNDKPITQTTYTFETTRRYEGVLKNKRDVRRFERYNAMEHVRVNE